MVNALSSEPVPDVENKKRVTQCIAERVLFSMSAWAALGVGVLLALPALFCITHFDPDLPGAGAVAGPAVGATLLIFALLVLKGLVVLQPNQAVVCLFLGAYRGTLARPGFWWINPFYSREKVSLRLKTEESGPLKVNDAVGNPVEIGAVIIWRVSEAACALLEVDDYQDYVAAQSETTLRVLASQYPYDPTEQPDATGHPPEYPIHSGLTLRDGSDALAGLLLNELQQRMVSVGIEIVEARISHLAYAPEIAGAMLRKQAASAVISARRIITEGAVAIIDDALNSLEKRMGAPLPPEQRAAMISNLLVVLIGDREATPTVNAGM